MVGTDDVSGAYGARFAQITDMLGTTVQPMDPDRAVIEPWAKTVGGRILDVGSGTGRWSGHLAGLGYDIEGIDPAEQFVEVARRAHPAVAFRVAAVDDLAGSDERWAGILSWYSLIHLEPDSVRGALRVLRDVLEDEGSILLSFFSGPRIELIDHPVAPAYRWPVAGMSEALSEADFQVLNRHGSDRSQHAAITARVA